MTTKEVNKYWEVIKALKDGQIIQYKSKYLPDWIDVKSPSFNRSGSYRIKPTKK
jgi:hypothetical protein